jgi:hypothetical protein
VSADRTQETGAAEPPPDEAEVPKLTEQSPRSEVADASPHESQRTAWNDTWAAARSEYLKAVSSDSGHQVSEPAEVSGKTVARVNELEEPSAPTGSAG